MNNLHLGQRRPPRTGLSHTSHRRGLGGGFLGTGSGSATASRCMQVCLSPRTSQHSQGSGVRPPESVSLTELPDDSASTLCGLGSRGPRGHWNRSCFRACTTQQHAALQELQLSLRVVVPLGMPLLHHGQTVEETDPSSSTGPGVRSPEPVSLTELPDDCESSHCVMNIWHRGLRLRSTSGVGGGGTCCAAWFAAIISWSSQ